MKQIRTKWIIGAAIGISLIGAGCGSSDKKDDPAFPLPEPVDLEVLEPVERTAHVNFIPGSVIQIESAFTGFKDKIDLNQNTDAKTILVVDRFAPLHVANFTWTLLVNSKDAKGEATTQQLTANVLGANLNDSPRLWLPVFWPEEEKASARGTSGIWISRDRFEGLHRNRISTIDTSLLDPDSYGALGEDPNVHILFERLASEAKRVSTRVDVNLSKGEKDLVRIPMLINGKTLDIEVLKVTNWFGEFLILDNPQNPLVLSFSFQDKNESGVPRFKGADLFKKLVDYRVTALKDIVS